jgi:hypothetical protein
MTNKKPVKWLPLDVDALEDPKVMALVMALGMEGWGIYTMLIMFLAKQEPQYQSTLDSLKYLAYRNHISDEKIKAVVQGFGLFELDESHFYSPSLIKRMEGYDNIRQMNKEKAEKRWNKVRELYRSNAPALPMQSQKRREEKNRIEKNRIENKREDKNISLPSDLTENQNELLVRKWYEWCDFRKLLKKPYKTTPGAAAAYNKLLKLADNNSETAIAIIGQSMENEWLGFFPLKIVQRPAILPGEDPIARGIREVKAAREARLKREESEKLLQDIEYETMLENVKNGDKG